MDALTWMAGLTMLLLVVFDYTNGFHDTANMIATSVATHAMTPTQAIMLVGVFTFLGPLLGGTAVAETVGQFVELDDLARELGMAIVLAGVAGAIGWNLLTWWRGLPSSSSHALVGGLVGSVLVAAGPEQVRWGWAMLIHEGQWTGVTKIAAALILSPLAGLVAGYALHKLMRAMLRAATPRIERPLAWSQWLSAAWLAFAHGTNDGQKSMGVITLVLVLGGFIPNFDVPFWVMLMCATAITLGTLAGGWRIVRTVGFGIYRLRLIHGVDSQFASASVIGAAAWMGGPVSTTHVVSSTIMGVGAAERPKAVRWGKAGELLFTWVVTLPVAGMFGGSIAFLLGA